MASREITTDATLVLATGESILFTIDLTSGLASGETLSAISGTNGGVTLGCTTDAGSTITVGTPSINAGAITYTKPTGESATIAIGKAVQVRLTDAGLAVGKQYELTTIATTTDSNRIKAATTIQGAG